MDRHPQLVSYIIARTEVECLEKVSSVKRVIA